MRATILAAIAALLAACDGDDGAFPDGNPGMGSDDAAAACGAPFGSCSTAEGALCDDYAGAISPEMGRTSCTNAGGVWADAPCATGSTVGACRIEQPTGDGRQWCVTTWWFPPATTDSAMHACPFPGVFIPPP